MENHSGRAFTNMEMGGFRPGLMFVHEQDNSFMQGGFRDSSFGRSEEEETRMMRFKNHMMHMLPYFAMTNAFPEPSENFRRRRRIRQFGPLFMQRTKRGKDICSDISEEEEIQARTIIVENFSDEYTEEELNDVFCSVGSVKSIRVRNPCDPDRAGSSNDILISDQLHAIVEYENRRAAKIADTKNWGKDVRVRAMCKP